MNSKEPGRFILCGDAINRVGECLPCEAEALAIREALSWIKTAGWSNVDVESDALQLTRAIQSKGNESAFGIIVDDINEISASITGIEFSHVKRSANRAAHDLAKAAGSMSGRCVWIDVPLIVLFPP
ncbi:unnamed protein product [Cuscuta epithymum]|uniref:RNase H type-1 domain-containing protein n=1 Tax=Cuscuta epithymum TaxID=186058 RepID=A0AAV0D118_9ASTE|nr:unnamed protein product [Cuscuta epithymum]